MIFTLETPTLPLDGQDFPVRRIFCIGRNYADHAAEMGNEVDREKPFFFTKSAHALTTPGDVPYPPGTADLHHEVELVLAIGAELSGATPDQAAAAIIGRAVGIDMTRRDLQAEAKDKRRPWDAAKDFDFSAVIAPLSSAPAGPGIRLSVNGAVRQDGRLDQMIFSEAEIVAFLSTLYRLMPGDLVMTGTPAGVSALMRGDQIEASIDGLPPLSARIT
ncbi:fumarylacetoacetate hydrolase family protein [Paracoccus sp. M683]|uniref:fumarylacetoacetate hydrolase family protein n=1 Tax=Paracoccus sp. M683 TaxID=2594268 RepID=UPI00117DB68E|nr:fumarylacetoacetate hydrolase family protein [Paracoccus sp. M683]TRW99657.1 fumarylacetoacetate hydrolase family protein [Paracoccus sp. M683]